MNYEMVKWDCGCVGLKPDPCTLKAIVLTACDSGQYDSTDIAVFQRDMSGKASTPLTHAETLEVFGRIAHYVWAGDKFKELKRLLA